MPSVSVRQIKGESIGKMMKIKGIVTRISNVKPLAIVSAYSCDACGNEVFQDVRSSNFEVEYEKIHSSLF
jgi:DNA replication licensing factor MCM7